MESDVKHIYSVQATIAGRQRKKEKLDGKKAAVGEQRISEPTTTTAMYFIKPTKIEQLKLNKFIIAASYIRLI